jgi:hypothetical protein
MRGSEATLPEQAAVRSLISDPLEEWPCGRRVLTIAKPRIVAGAILASLLSSLFAIKLGVLAVILALTVLVGGSVGRLLVAVSLVVLAVGCSAAWLAP